MIYGRIKVVDKIDNDEVLKEAKEDVNESSLRVAGLDTEKYAVAEVKEGLQELTVTIDETGFSPALLIVQKDIEVKIKFKAENIDESNDFVVFPEYNGALDLSGGQFETPELIPEEDFTFLSYSGLFPGYVKVVDDLSKIDIDEIKKEAAEYETELRATEEETK